MTRKGAKLDLRIEPELLDTFKKEAEARGMKLAPWVRLACLNLLHGSGTDTRDSMAAVAMHALWARPPVGMVITEPKKMFDQVADLAYQFADAMLAARDKKKRK